MKKIIIRSLNFKYDKKYVLNDININIEEGKFYSIVGPNGSGKSTLLKIIAREIKVDKKNFIKIDDKNIKFYKNKEFAKKISIVCQNINMYSGLKNKEIVLMGRLPYLNYIQEESKFDYDIVKKSMQKTSTLHLRNYDIMSISGGERQRIILARSLAQKSSIILLDEPITQLDLKYQIEIMNFLKFMVLKTKKTIIIILHDLNLASKYSDFMFLFKKGKIIAKGIAEKVITKKNLNIAYGIKVSIIKNPITKKPFIIHSKC